MGKGRDKRKKKKDAAASDANLSAATDKTKAKKQAKKMRAELGEPEEDIDAILADFRREQEEQIKITETVGCAPPSRRCNASLSTNPLNPAELILFGGEFYDGQRMNVYNDLYKYNIDKNEWRSISSPNSPGPRSSHQAVCTPSGRMFLWGGEFVSPNETSFFHWKEGMWMLDLKTNAWEKLEMRVRPPPRSGHRMVLWKHLIVMFGGFFDTTTETKYYDDAWVFDCNEFKWIKLEIPEPKPSARSGFQFLVHGDTITLFGGYTKTYAKGKKVVGLAHSDLWTLKMSMQLDAIRWERRKKPGGHAPSLRSGCSMTVHKGRGILFGGVSDMQETEETLESVCHDDMYQLAIDSNKWYLITLRANKPAKNQSKKTAKAQQKQTQKDFRNSDDDQNDQHDDDDETALPTVADPLQPCARFNAMMSVTRNTLYMFGGILEGKSREVTLCDLWSLNLDKMQEWIQLIADERAVQLVGDSSDDDEDEDESDSDDDDESDEDAMDDEQDDSAATKTNSKSETTPSELKMNSAASSIESLTLADAGGHGHASDPAHETDEERRMRIALDPLPEETLRTFYERTTILWQMRARDETDATGKALRRDAFELAQEHFEQLQPQLQEVRKLMQENDSVSQKNSNAGPSATNMNLRHRR